MEQTYEQLIQGLLDKGFGTVDNFFTPEELVSLRKSLLSHYQKEDFHQAGIGNKTQLQTVDAVRKDHIYWLDKSKANEEEQACLQKVDDFITYLNRTCYVGIQEYELHYAVYDKGAYYKKHVDKFQNDDRRKFSVVFYLTEQWNEGDGGELLMYTKDETITIQPQSGRMIFFDSTIPHEVLLSHTQRLSMTGWMKTR